MLQAREQHVHHHHHHHHYHHHRTHQAAVGPTLMEPAAIAAEDLARTFPLGELIGREVHNDMGLPIGRLDDLLMEGAEAPYAVLWVKGPQDGEGRRVVVAYHELSFSDRRLVLPGADRDRLDRLLVYERGCAAAAPAFNGVDHEAVSETAFHEAVPGLVTHITDGAA